MPALYFLPRFRLAYLFLQVNHLGLSGHLKPLSPVLTLRSCGQILGDYRFCLFVDMYFLLLFGLMLIFDDWLQIHVHVAFLRIFKVPFFALGIGFTNPVKNIALGLLFLGRFFFKLDHFLLLLFKFSFFALIALRLLEFLWELLNHILAEGLSLLFCWSLGSSERTLKLFYKFV